MTYLLPLGMDSCVDDDVEDEVVSLDYVLKALNAKPDTVNCCCSIAAARTTSTRPSREPRRWAARR